MGPWPSGHGGGREVGENGEEAEGVRFPYSPRAEVVCGGRATVAGYGRGGGAADLEKGRAVVEEVVVAESCAEALFIGRERRWRQGCGGARRGTL